MKQLWKVLLVLTMLFSLAGTAWAAAPADPESIEVEFKSVKDSYSVGEKIKLTVETTVGGTFKDIKLQVLPIVGGDEDDEIKNIKTTGSKSKYTTTGYITPSKSGLYMIAATASMTSGSKVIEAEASAVLDVKDPKKITLAVTPGDAEIQLGQEIPVLITYSSKYSTKFTYSEKVTELASKKVNGVYKKVVLFKPDEKGTHSLKVTAESKYDKVSETIEVEVK
ncbi:hypothetical protein [Brevibacillus migulae]|uniref:hypothetical protein n=1 Tax=Brevibacillus migulae TaxID=1644114 RepID=UPI00106E20EB|nr:hypothetical protein [Brevibacillus migulae]